MAERLNAAVLRTGRGFLGPSLKGYTERIRACKDPPVQRVHEQFIEKGGRFLRLSDDFDVAGRSYPAKEDER